MFYFSNRLILEVKSSIFVRSCGRGTVVLLQHYYFTRLNPKRMGTKLMGLLHTSGYSEQPSCYKNCTRNCIRNKTFLFVRIETYNFHNLYDLGFCETSQNSILSNKILYLNVTRIALFHSNLIAMKLCNSCNFFVYQDRWIEFCEKILKIF